MFPSVLAFVTFLLVFSTSVYTQDSAAVVCIAGQCVEGFTDLTLGTRLSAPGGASDLLLLPGQYSETTNPSLLHSILTTASATLQGSPGFTNASQISLPVAVQLDPGFAYYSAANYSGSATFVALPTSANASNLTTPINPESFVLSSNTWAEVSTANGGRLILWDAAPDLAQLPGSLSGLTLKQLQSGACSTSCASGGVCTAQGACACLPGFTGASCEACETGFFGPECQACPAGCATCDDGINGSGVCLKTISQTQNCNCLNGVCASDGSCACNAGWVDSTNGTKCASCADGFFLSNDGSCKVCNLGCETCSASTGTCTACKSGFTISSSDSTKCNPPTSATNTGQVCPDGSFSNGTACAACDSQCNTCSGGTSDDCIVCGTGRSSLNGTCVAVDSSGVCQTGLTSGSGFVVDNNKKECEACPEKCTACSIPGFSVASTIDQAQCTACLPGFVLSGGQCIESCPSGTFLDPKDNLTCTACSSTCGTCAGSATFCLSCTNNQLASSGSCVTSCPSNTFSSSGACVSCHPDCATCSGESFNQCSTCPSDRPVLSNGRCLPTCSKTEFFDTASGSCKNCDSSCASCSASGSQSCLSCSDSGSVLRSGSCVTATCTDGTSVVSGLGACLSDLVIIPSSDSTGSGSAALPSITGINSPTVIESGTHLQWWQILLMALGVAFLILALLFCWRRRARRKRAEATRMFAIQRGLDNKLTWKERIVRFGERLFGHQRSRAQPIMLAEMQQNKFDNYRDVEEARLDFKYLDAKSYSTKGHERRDSRYWGTSDARSKRDHHHHSRSNSSSSAARYGQERDVDLNSMSDTSMYTYVTGHPRRADARQPVRAPPVPTTQFGSVTEAYPHRSRFSISSYYATVMSGRDRDRDQQSQRARTPADEIARDFLEKKRGTGSRSVSRERELGGSKVDYGLLDAGPLGDLARGEPFLRPNHTGSSSSSRNPFRQ